MSKRRTKAYPPAPPPQESRLLTNADALAEPNPTIPAFAVDPLDAYEELKHDVLCRRQLVWDIYRQNEDAQSIESAIVGALADSEIILNSTKPTSQQTSEDRAQARQMMQVINRAMGRRGGYLEFLKGFVAGFLGSVTGAFVPLVYDRFGDMAEIGIIDPMLTRPYFTDDQSQVYYDPSGTEHTARFLHPAGIWYRGQGGFFTSLPSTLYYQAVYGAYGRGAWIVGRPLAEENLQILTLGTALRQFIRKSIYGLDASQVLIMNFVDKEAFFAQIAQRKELLAKKGPKNPGDRGNVIAITQNNPDKGAEVKSVNMRGLPEGINMVEFLDLVAATTAKGFGLKASRLATIADKARYAGSGAQAAQQESDEWGRSIVQAALLSFFNNYLLADKPFVAKVVGTDDPKAYAKIAYDKEASQTVSQLTALAGDSPQRQEQLWEYLVQCGVMPPATVGAIAVTQSAVKAAGDPDEIDKNTEACAQDLNALWAAFVANDLPEAVDAYGVDDRKLQDELQYISQLLIAQAIRCIRNAAGGVRDAYVRNLENQARLGLTNLVGRPQDWTETLRPMFPAYTAAMSISPLIAVGTATLADLQNQLLKFGRYVDDYANLSKQAAWYGLGKGSSVPVNWVRTARESCPDCVNFEGPYPDFATLLQTTNGRLPGSPALADKGHCQCYLTFGGPQ